MEYGQAVDSRVSGRIRLSAYPAPSYAAALPTDLVLAQLLVKALLALALFVAREWILAQGFPLLALHALLLVTGAVGLALWERVWQPAKGAPGRNASSAPLYGAAYMIEILLYLAALSRISTLRHVMLTCFCTLWTRGVPLSFLSSAGGKKALGKNNAVFISTAMVLASYLLDRLLSSDVSIVGYGCILAHLLACGQRSDLLASHVGEYGSRGRFHALGVAHAAAFASALASVRWLFSSAAVPVLFDPLLQDSLSNASNLFTVPPPTLSLLLPASILLGATLVIIDPLLTRALCEQFSPARLVSTGWPVAFISTVFVGYVGFGQGVSVAEVATGGIAWTAISHLISSDPRSSMVASSSSVTTSAPHTPFLARLSSFYRHLRATVKTILDTPDSRRIYFFLCLNLAYMVVQMVYGIWTNSLGLISDSIHMFFDCLALGMGLFASVMATWQPNDKFTYGYSRVETLSGFANGLFLCLISIFIVFEAIQRLLDPPEMNTSQLLVVSSVGLAVNLVGMFATGHHHHGHSHGGHDHGHDHAPKPKKKVESSDGGHAHDHGHAHTDHSTHDHSSHDHASHGHDAHDHSSHAGHDHDEDKDDHAGHSHSGHSHNMKGVFLHVMADTLGSVGVIISTLLINRYGWTGFDPLASIFIAVLIFASVVPLVVDSGKLLVLDMGDEREEEVKQALLGLKSVEGLSSYTAARFWSKDPSTMIGSIHIQLAPSSSGEAHQFASVDRVTARVNRVLRNAIGGLEELCIQVEPGLA